MGSQKDPNLLNSPVLLATLHRFLQKDVKDVSDELIQPVNGGFEDQVLFIDYQVNTLGKVYRVKLTGIRELHEVCVLLPSGRHFQAASCYSKDDNLFLVSADHSALLIPATLLKREVSEADRLIKEALEKGAILVDLSRDNPVVHECNVILTLLFSLQIDGETKKEFSSGYFNYWETLPPLAVADTSLLMVDILDLLGDQERVSIAEETHLSFKVKDN